MTKVKADYKHKMVVHGAQPKRFTPNFLRLLCAMGIAIVVSIVWYQRTPNVIEENEIDIPEESIVAPVNLADTNDNALENQLNLVALAPLSPLKEKIDAVEAPGSYAKWRQYKIEPGKNLSFYLSQAGLDSKAIHEIMQVKHRKQLSKVFPGQKLRMHTSAQDELVELALYLSPTKSIKIHQENGKFISTFIEQPVEVRITMEGATIQDSLYMAGKRANLNDNMIMELAEIFAYDIDFALDIHPNDNFKVVFEEHYIEGEKVDNGPILAAEFVNQGQRYTAIRFKDEDQVSYYTPEGKSLKKAFIRTPVEYTRISSHFNLQRRHPVLHHIRAHKGVDYAAPTGTPVKAAGDGKVEFIGKKGGYGNVIILQHGKKYSTLYAHLHKFNHKLKKGSHVKQNQTIAYVGKTGLATGPHLHYEFRINDVHHNPLTVKLPQADPLTKDTKRVFLAKAKEYQHLLKLQENIMLAQNENPRKHH